MGAFRPKKKRTAKVAGAPRAARGVKAVTARAARRKPTATDSAKVIALRLDSARRAFSSDAEVAEALGVDRAQLPRWRAGQVPDRENADRLAGLDIAVQLLSGYLRETSIPKWLNGINSHLDNRRPLTLLRAGQLADVIAAIESMKSEAYA
jgi:hypothetical protein